MPIKFVTGHLFANRYKAQALAHGCNCQGSMGAGIATGFRDRYPEMFAEYRRRCKAQPPQFNLGDAWLWKADDQPWVFNLGTQEHYWRARASYEAIEMALTSMRRQADREGIETIAVPGIGAGHGGLSWKKVRGGHREGVRGLGGNHVRIRGVYSGEGRASARPQGMKIPIIVESRRKKWATIKKAWPGALILDVTSKGEKPWERFSPFYSHGGIPVPKSPGTLDRLGEGVWQVVLDSLGCLSLPVRR
jgi:O-acetyl-ADP-ribose deacetylase (regulator of RNase III)